MYLKICPFLSGSLWISVYISYTYSIDSYVFLMVLRAWLCLLQHFLQVSLVVLYIFFWLVLGMRPPFPLSIARTMFPVCFICFIMFCVSFLFIVCYGLFGQVQLSPSVCFVRTSLWLCVLLLFQDSEAYGGTISPLSHFSMQEMRAANLPSRPAYLCVISWFSSQCFDSQCQDGNCQAAFSEVRRTGQEEANWEARSSKSVTLSDHLLRTLDKGSFQSCATSRRRYR